MLRGPCGILGLVHARAHQTKRLVRVAEMMGVEEGQHPVGVGGQLVVAGFTRGGQRVGGQLAGQRGATVLVGEPGQDSERIAVGDQQVAAERCMRTVGGQVQRLGVPEHWPEVAACGVGDAGLAEPFSSGLQPGQRRGRRWADGGLADDGTRAGDDSSKEATAFHVADPCAGLECFGPSLAVWFGRGGEASELPQLPRRIGKQAGRVDVGGDRLVDECRELVGRALGVLLERTERLGVVVHQASRRRPQACSSARWSRWACAFCTSVQ